MRFIPTSAAIVESLKKQAKKLQRNGGGKHADLLDRVAKGAGYQHWHHVSICLKQTETKSGVEALHLDCDIILRAAREGVEKVIVTNAGELPVPLVMFACQQDAWLLDPDESLVLCLMFQGEEQERHFEDSPRQIRIGWDGTYAFNGEAFVVATEHPTVGTRVILGYPLEELRRWIDKAQAYGKRFDTSIAQDDAIDLTPDLAARLIAEGWEAKSIEEGRRDGARFSPSRNILVYPQIADSDDDSLEPAAPSGGM